MQKQPRGTGNGANRFPMQSSYSSKQQRESYTDSPHPPSNLPGASSTTGNSTSQPLANGRMSEKTPTRRMTDGFSGPRPSTAMNARPHTPSDYDSKNSDAGATSQVNPTSALLQDLIREQRATRGSRRAASEAPSDLANTTPTKTQSQDDSSSERQRKINNALSAGLKQPREMGIREMDEYVSKMNKLNFDLKLEIFHRTQRTMALEKKLERMHAMEEELERMHGLEEELEELREVEENNQRLRESNEQLQLDLDKRDQAVNEAVELICQLESKLDGLEPDRDELRPSTAIASANTDEPDEPDAQDSSARDDETPKRLRILDVPDRVSSWKGTGSGRSMRYRNVTPDSLHHARRTPSFLREKNGSTSALRSVYMADETRSRTTSSALSKTGSILSGDEQPEPESPRLSILSECSYLTPYKSPSNHLDFDMSNGSRLEGDFTDSPTARLDKSRDTIDEGKLSRVDRWIQPQESQAKSGEQEPAEYSTATVVKKDIPRKASLDRPFQANRTSKRRPYESPRLDIPVFDGSRLPPTPDTMSTSITGPRSGSNSSVIAEKSQFDQAPFYTSFALNTTLDRPRSADDVTTRPSSVASQSGSMETTCDATQNRLPNRSGYETPTMLPSYRHESRRPKTSHIHAGSLDNPRLRSKGNSFKGAPDVIEEADSSCGKKNYAASLKSTTSEPNSIRFARADSPPLTPQDWLEAALPLQSKREEAADEGEPELPPNAVSQLDPDTPIPSIEPAENRASFLSRRPTRRLGSEGPIPERSSSLRLRVSKNRAPTNVDVQPRRRINLKPRFFSRSATPNDAEQVPMSDPVDKDSAPSANIRTKFLSAVRRQSVSSAAEMGPGRADTPLAGKESNNDTSQPPHSAGIPPSRGSVLRPPTSDSAEYKRRSSYGLLGWMRGASGQNKDGGDPTFLPSPANIIRAMSPDKEKPFAPSGLANSTPAPGVDPQADDHIEEQATTGEDDELDRRTRHGRRRSRVV